MRKILSIVVAFYMSSIWVHSETSANGYLVFNGVATNADYEVSWAGPFSEVLTLMNAFSKCDGGTNLIWVVEQATNSAWRTFTSTNNILSGTTSGSNDTTWTDSSIAIGNFVGVVYKSGTDTNWMVTIKYMY